MEYKKILRLTGKDRMRDTLYSEVLDLISSYECGLAAMIKQQSEQLGRKLNNWEMTDLFTAFETLPLWKPLIVRARTKMASRDMALRDAFHFQLDLQSVLIGSTFCFHPDFIEKTTLWFS